MFHCPLITKDVASENEKIIEANPENKVLSEIMDPVYFNSIMQAAGARVAADLPRRTPSGTSRVLRDASGAQLRSPAPVLRLRLRRPLPRNFVYEG